MTWQVGGGRKLGGNTGAIIVGECHQAFIKRPVAEVAQSQAIAGVVVVADAPGDDVRGRDSGMSI